MKALKCKTLDAELAQEILIVYFMKHLVEGREEVEPWCEGEEKNSEAEEFDSFPIAIVVGGGGSLSVLNFSVIADLAIIALYSIITCLSVYCVDNHLPTLNDR